MSKPALVVVAPTARDSGGSASVETGKAAEPMLTGLELRRPRRRSAEEKLAIVLESLRADEPNIQTCRRYQISEPTLYKWRQLLFDGGKLFLEAGGRPNLPDLVEANRQLKEAFADLSLAYRRLRQTSRSPSTKR